MAVGGMVSGAFMFLQRLHHRGFAASLAWLLILGYILTASVYAFTFGHYLAHALSFGAWFPRLSALLVIVVLTWVNLRGVGESSLVEIITVWGKLMVLLGLALLGLLHWAPKQLTAGVFPETPAHALAGAAAIFMTYEGFQLLTYDYDDTRDVPRLLPLASISAVLAVIVLYVVVALGATMLVGAAAAAVVLTWQMVTGDPLVPVALVVLAAMVLIATVGRPCILRPAQQDSR